MPGTKVKPPSRTERGRRLGSLFRSRSWLVVAGRPALRGAAGLRRSPAPLRIGGYRVRRRRSPVRDRRCQAPSGNPVQSHGLAMAIECTGRGCAWRLRVDAVGSAPCPMTSSCSAGRWPVRWIPEGWPHVRPLPLALWRVVFASGGDWTALALPAMPSCTHSMPAWWPRSRRAGSDRALDSVRPV